MQQRDKAATQQKLIEAVGQIIREKGFQGLGINSVAQTAGVDKVLIYRYFSDLNGLIRAYLAQEDYFANLDKITENTPIDSKKDLVQMSRQLFIGQLHEVLKNQALQEILLWELTQKNEILDELAQIRETKGVALNRRIEKVVDLNRIDLPALTSLLIGGIYYLVLRSRNVDVYNGIDLASDTGWQRLENSINLIIDLIAEKI